MKLVFLGALLFLTPAYSYRFLCNGVTAENITESDNCTQSCTDFPPRWANASVTYNVDISVLPAGVSASDWLTVANSCFSNWASTPGVKLTVTNGGLGVRSFGTNPGSHDIFWVTSSDEWMTRVGAAPNGILGVTLPPYACPNPPTVDYRRLEDADMILNAVPEAGFIWEAGCPQLSADCQSAKATVAHESGHFLGLGHPCAACQELMSAQAEFLIEYPLFDDQQGMAALYPNSAAAGSFGTVCSSTQACSSGLTCHSQAGAQYCSNACTGSGDCGNHMICTAGFCEFPAGTALGAVGLHEDCTQNPCDAGLICVGVDSLSAYCFADCTTSQACQTSETCHQLKKQHVLVSSYACMKETGGSGGTSNVSPPSSCSSVKAPSELWLLLLFMGILVHRPKKKC